MMAQAALGPDSGAPVRSPARVMNSSFSDHSLKPQARDKPCEVHPLENVPLAPETTLGVGGRARFFCEVTSEAELVAAVDWALSRGLSLQVLGGGSNVVVAEQGYD